MPSVITVTQRQRKRNETNVLILAIMLGAIMGWLSTSGDKSQWIRILDIAMFGPLLILISLQPEVLERLNVQIVVGFLGASTITYNLKNFLSQM